MKTSYCTLHTAHFKPHTSNCTINSAFYKVQIADSILQTAHYYFVHGILHTEPRALHTAQSIVFIANPTVHTWQTAHHKLHTSHFTLHTTDCRLNTAHCTKIVLAGSLNSSLQQGAASWPYTPHQTLRGLEGGAQGLYISDNVNTFV